MGNQAFSGYNPDALKMWVDNIMAKSDAHYRTQLEDRKAQILALELATHEDRKPVELDQSKVGRLSRMDALQVQAMSSALDERRKSEVSRINAALARLDEGEYGYCLVCGEDIEERRLDLDPSAPKCTACAGAKKA